MRNLTHSLTLVLISSVLAGVCSGIITATSFMPVYSFYYNWRQWSPGSEEVLVLGEVDGSPESRVIHASGWEELRELGLPASRLWFFDAKTAEKPLFALVAHGMWVQNNLHLGDEISLNLHSGEKTVPVAGVWHPFHPQLGEDWVVLIGDTELAVATGTVRETLAPLVDSPKLPGNFRGRNLLSWLLFNVLGFILYGALGLIDIQGRCAALSWGAKLWVGGALAVLTALATAALVFHTLSPLPILSLLPMTLGFIIASYLLAVFLLTVLCLVISWQ